MTLQGKHVEEVSKDSETFTMMQAHFFNTIMALYKISYHDMDSPRYENDSEWTFPVFHGTSHCGCLTKRISQDHYRIALAERPTGQDTDDDSSQDLPMVVSTPVDVSNRQTTIVSSDWCKNSTCETQGILKSGFLKSASQNDNPSHYFTTSTTLAVERAAHRKMTFFFSPVFICEVETSKVIKGVYPDTNYVKEDYEITPCYLAIILNSDTNTIRQIRRVADLY